MNNLTVKFVEEMMKFADENNISILRLCRIIRKKPGNFYRWKSGRVSISLSTVEEIQTMLEKEFGKNLDIVFKQGNK